MSADNINKIMDKKPSAPINVENSTEVKVYFVVLRK